MGLPFSAFNKFGLAGLSSVTTGQVYDRHFKDKETGNLEDFHVAYVEFCKYFNTVMPGQDFYTPPLKTIKDFYEKWKSLDDGQKRKEFFEFMEKHVREDSVGASLFIMAGLAAPAAAIIAKRSTESIPQVKKFKLHLIPNVVFVPVCTLFAIMGVTAIKMNKKSKP